MKKQFIALCMALVGLCASAQEKGDMAAGLNLGVSPLVGNGGGVTNFGLGAKFQYNVSNPIRLEADIDYWFKSQGMGVFDISANAHYLFKLSDKFNLYPTVGIGYGHVSSVWDDVMDELNDWASSIPGYDYDDEDLSFSGNRFLFNVGIGAEYAVTDKISVGAEFKYQFMKDFGRLPITIGVTYKF